MRLYAVTDWLGLVPIAVNSYHAYYVFQKHSGTN